MRNQPKARLLIVLPAMNPYWARRLSELSSVSRGELVVVLLGKIGSGREWRVPPEQFRFRYKLVEGGRLAVALKLLLVVLRSKPTHVLSFHFVVAVWPLLLLRRLLRIRLGYYVEKTWESWFRRTPAKELLKRWLLRAADVIFVPGADAREYVTRYRGLKKGYWLLPHVVDVSFLRGARRDRPGGDGVVTVLYLGRLVEEKGLYVLLDAIEELDDTDLSRLRFEVVGSGPLSKDVEQLSKTGRVDVSWRPFVQAEHLIPVLRRADVLVFPTLGDPYGLVVDEALAAGLPVLSSDAAGEVFDRLCAGGFPRGLIHHAGNASELAQHISSLTKESDLIRQLSLEASRYANDRPDYAAWSGQLLSWASGKEPTSAPVG